MFYVVQATTMLILITGANTAFSGFPYLVNFVANDGFLPRQLTKRGHRLAFSNGIILLSAGATFLVLITGASVNHLVAFYALGVFTGFALVGFGMGKRAVNNKDKGWLYKAGVNYVSGVVSAVIIVIFAVVKFTEGAWVILAITPVIVYALIRLNGQYRREQAALRVGVGEDRATSITRHDATVLVDAVDLATLGTIRYARSLKPRKLNAVHFVIDDRHADEIKEAWATNPALDDVSLELIDCPDRRLPNAALDYAIRTTQTPNVELTLLLPRRAYSAVLGRLLHDQTADEIAKPISQLPRVVATIVPFDVTAEIREDAVASEVVATPVAPTVTTRRVSDPIPEHVETSHYSENIIPIATATWRKRAHVRGQVTAIRTAPSGSNPRVEIEVWDETGGITLQFLGRREIIGLDVGSTLCAEGMVGEDSGALTILNPSYEIVI